MVETDYFFHMTKPSRHLICNTPWWKVQCESLSSHLLEKHQSKPEGENTDEYNNDSIFNNYDEYVQDDPFVQDFEMVNVPESEAYNAPPNNEDTRKDIGNQNEQIEENYSEQFKRDFEEFYETDTLSEFDTLLGLDFNSVKRAQATLPAISAAADKNEEDDNLGLRWGIGYWLRFDALKRKKKKKIQDNTTTNNHPDDCLFDDLAYNPLGFYGISIKDNRAELFDYLNVTTLAEAKQDDKRNEYTQYMSHTHDRKPTFLQHSQEMQLYYNNYFESHMQ